MVCCAEDGPSTLFVGMHEPGAPVPHFNAEPTGSVKLPADAIRLYDRLMTATGEAVRKGRAGEDDSHGYSLSEDPAARALGVKFHEYAVAHTEELYRVLAESGDVNQREAAAEAPGFAEESQRQVAALVHASFDPSDDVRNNAIRALGVLLRYDPKVVAQIPLEPYIAMLHFSDWLDRDKTIAVLDGMTMARDPKVLAELRAQALTPLREMAQWRSTGHTLGAILILGRMVGLDDATSVHQILKVGK
jgi:HEAT repeat protein